MDKPTPKPSLDEFDEFEQKRQELLDWLAEQDYEKAQASYKSDRKPLRCNIL